MVASQLTLLGNITCQVGDAAGKVYDQMMNVINKINNHTYFVKK